MVEFRETQAYASASASASASRSASSRGESKSLNGEVLTNNTFKNMLTATYSISTFISSLSS